MNKTFKLLKHELTHHLPFTFFATIGGIALVILIQYLLKISISESAFEILHPLHIIVSGAASAAIFYKYKKNFMYAVFVGVISSITIGTLSDVLVPYFGAISLGFNPEFHLPLIEDTVIVLGASILGSIIGIKAKLTKFPHSAHVFLSVFASLFYLLAFVGTLTPILLILSIIIVSIAVVIPCCISDILIPFFFIGKKINQCGCNSKL